MTKQPTALDNAQTQLTEVANILKLDSRTYDILKAPMRELSVRFPVAMDDGSTRIFQGYRFQHNWALGPTRGGVRFHQDETADDVRALAMWMTVKNAANNIPNGGAKGGIAVDPSTLSKRELERLCRGYIRAIAQIVGPWNDFPGADVGTSMATQSWMLDEWETMHQRLEPAGISGKAVLLGGSQGRAQATGRGILFATEEVAQSMGMQLKNLRAVVQGLGKVGGSLLQVYIEAGVSIVGVSDVTSAVVDPNGLDGKDILAYVQKNGSLKGYPKGKTIPKEDIFAVDCDVLAPCAIQNAITAENADTVKAKMIIEGANGPTSPEAEKILAAKGIFVCPDVYANSAGTQVAHFERMQNLYNDSWTEEQVNTKLRASFAEVFAELYAVSQENKFSMRMAFWVKAIRKVTEAMQWRGWI